MQAQHRNPRLVEVALKRASIIKSGHTHPMPGSMHGQGQQRQLPLGPTKMQGTNQKQYIQRHTHALPPLCQAFT